jgi:hypothetical protein
MSTSLPPSAHPAASLMPTLHWTEAGAARSAIWRSERGAAPPGRVVLADDSTSADDAYRLACEGNGLLWRGDFQNARLLLQAMARRADKPAKEKRKKKEPPGAEPKIEAETAVQARAAQGFHLHRQAQAQRARVLGMLLLPMDADYRMPLRRAPDARLACAEAWGPAETAAGPSVIALRELLGLISAHEWRKKGLEIAALGAPPNNRIHPHYGVFSPVRGEYVGLVAEALRLVGRAVPLAVDIGTGTGVLAALLARSSVARIVATDQDARALVCARENLQRLGVLTQVEIVEADLFPEGRAPLIVCNPPWLPARPSAPIERAVYDEGSRMLLGFLGGLAAHLAPGGEGWLILSDMAEQLGLRSRAELLAAINGAGLKVLGRLDAKPEHPKAADATDPLHTARAAEVTSLWRLGVI